MQDYDRIMGTNLESTYALCQLMQPLLVAGAAGGTQQQQQDAASAPGPLDPISRAKASPKGDACIIFISSVAGGPLAGRSGSLYAASKAALNQLAASFACEWAGQGIRVNSVAPWVTLTELGQQVRRGEHTPGGREGGGRCGMGSACSDWWCHQQQQAFLRKM
jgi:Tropinone reductase 1